MEELRGIRERITNADEALLKLITESARERFPNDGGWYRGGIIERCSVEIAQLVAARGLEPGVLDDTHRTLVWRTTVIHDAPGPDTKTAVENWTREVFTSLQADEYQAARKADSITRVTAAALLDPIVHHRAIPRTRECPICFPPRTR